MDSTMLTGSKQLLPPPPPPGFPQPLEQRPRRNTTKVANSLFSTLEPDEAQDDKDKDKDCNPSSSKSGGSKRQCLNKSKDSSSRKTNSISELPPNNENSSVVQSSSAAPEVAGGDDVEHRHWPPTAAAMTDDHGDGREFLIKAMALFPTTTTNVADESLISEKVAMGLSYLSDKDRELLLPFIKHFGWIVGPLPADDPRLEDLRRGLYRNVASFLNEVALVKSADAVSICNLQQSLHLMADLVKFKDDFVSFIYQFLNKMLQAQRWKRSLELQRTYQLKLSEYQLKLREATKEVEEAASEYKKPWQYK